MTEALVLFGLKYGPPLVTVVIGYVGGRLHEKRNTAQAALKAAVDSVKGDSK